MGRPKCSRCGVQLSSAWSAAGNARKCPDCGALNLCKSHCRCGVGGAGGAPGLGVGGPGETPSAGSAPTLPPAQAAASSRAPDPLGPCRLGGRSSDMELPASITLLPFYLEAWRPFPITILNGLGLFTREALALPSTCVTIHCWFSSRFDHDSRVGRRSSTNLEPVPTWYASRRCVPRPGLGTHGDQGSQAGVMVPEPVVTVPAADGGRPRGRRILRKQQPPALQPAQAASPAAPLPSAASIAAEGLRPAQSAPSPLAALLASPAAPAKPLAQPAQLAVSGQIMELAAAFRKEGDESIWERFESRYSLHREHVGEGAFGTVMKATDAFGQEHAVKIIDVVEGCASGASASFAMRELEALKRLSHFNVVKLHEFFVGVHSLILVLERLEMDLQTYIAKQSPEKDKNKKYKIKKLGFQLCMAIEYVHGHGVIHRDLRPSNILVGHVAGELPLKVTGFGLCRAVGTPDPRFTAQVQTFFYRAPEILLDMDTYTFPIDLWSMGCIVAEMAIGVPIFHAPCQIGTILKICEVLGTPAAAESSAISRFLLMKDNFPKFPKKTLREHSNMMWKALGRDGCALLDAFFVYDPAQRITAEQAACHRFFIGVPVSSG